MTDNRKTYVCGILCLTVLLRVICVFLPVIDHLESMYSAIVAKIMDGERLYQDISALKLPFAFLPFHLVFLVFGRNNLLAVHVFSIAWAVLITFIVFRMAAYAYNYKIGIISAYLFAVFSATLNVSGSGTSPRSFTFMSFESEFTSCLPLTLTCFMLLKGIREKKYIFLSLSGIFWALSLSIHPKNGFFIFVIIGYLLVLSLTPQRIIKFSTLITYLFYFGLSALLGFLPLLLYLVSIKSLGGLLNFYFKVKDFMGGIDIFSIRTLWRFFLVFWNVCIKNNYLLWTLVLITFVIVVVNTVNRFRKQSRLTPKETDNYLQTNLLFMFWFLFSLGAIFADAPKFWRQHYGQLFPAAMVLGGYGLWAIWQKAKQRRTKLIKASIAFMVTVGSLYPIYINQVRQIQPVKKLRGYINYPIFEYVRQNTDVNDRVFTWGVFYDLYTLTNRVAATPFVANFELFGLVWTFPPSFVDVDPKDIEKFLEVINKKKPKLIIDPTGVEEEAGQIYGNFLWAMRLKLEDQGKPYSVKEVPFLYDFIQQHYFLKEFVDGFAIYQLKTKAE